MDINALKTVVNKKKKHKSRKDQCQAHNLQTNFRKVTSPFNETDIKFPSYNCISFCVEFKGKIGQRFVRVV